MFRSLDTANASALLADILDDGEIVRQPFKARQSSIAIAEEWPKLKHELMHVNRFFPRTNVALHNLTNSIWQLTLSPKEHESLWYRCRLMSGDTTIGNEDMGAPPKEYATPGRANPVGIPYLYLASDATTAISECRPHTGEKACVAKFTVDLTSLKLADLRSPRGAISPFLPESEEAVADLLQELAFLERLGEDLTMPVLPQSAATDYLSTQYFCELIKNGSFDGVVYRSSVGEGVNMALFDPTSAQAVSEPDVYVIGKVRVEPSLLPQDSSE